MCMSLHMHSPVCMFIQVLSPSIYINLHVHFPTICISSPCMSLCVCLLCVYVPSMCMSSPRVYPLRVYVSSVHIFPCLVCSFMYILPLRMSLCVNVTFCTCSFRVHVPPSVYRLWVIVPPCVFSSVRSLLEFELIEQQAGAVGQWGTQANVCAHVNLVVWVGPVGYRGSLLCPRQYRMRSPGYTGSSLCSR